MGDSAAWDYGDVYDGPWCVFREPRDEHRLAVKSGHFTILTVSDYFDGGGTLQERLEFICEAANEKIARQGEARNRPSSHDDTNRSVTPADEQAASDEGSAGRAFGLSQSAPRNAEKRHECQRCGSDEWEYVDYGGCSVCRSYEDRAAEDEEDKIAVWVSWALTTSLRNGLTCFGGAE